MTLKAPPVLHIFLSMFSLQTAIGMLRQGSTGEQILQILDVITSDVEETNINDFVNYAVALNIPTLQSVEF
jgi:hypothetical protein